MLEDLIPFLAGAVCCLPNLPRLPCGHGLPMAGHLLLCRRSNGGREGVKGQFQRDTETEILLSLTVYFVPS